MEIKYAKPIELGHRGRNGYFNAHGLYLSSTMSDTFIVIRGLSSRGVSSAAELSIGKDDLPALIRHLETLL